MKLIFVALCIALLASGTYAKSFNNHVRQNSFMGFEMEVSEDEPALNETWGDFYYGIILGWQTQQKRAGHWRYRPTAHKRYQDTGSPRSNWGHSPTPCANV